MGASGSIFIWNADKIRKKANATGGDIAKEWGDAPPFSVYTYVNPFGGKPKHLFVTYFDHNQNMNPLCGINQDFDTFLKMYKSNWSGMSMDADLPETALKEYFKFSQWCYKHALIVEWEVWT